MQNASYIISSKVLGTVPHVDQLILSHFLLLRLDSKRNVKGNSEYLMLPTFPLI